MSEEQYKVDPVALTVNQLIVHVGTLKTTIAELSRSVRAIIDCEPDAAVLGNLDAIDHVLRTLPL